MRKILFIWILVRPSFIRIPAVQAGLICAFFHQMRYRTTYRLFSLADLLESCHKTICKTAKNAERVGTPDFQSHFCGVIALLTTASVPVLDCAVQHISPTGWMSSSTYTTPP